MSSNIKPVEYQDGLVLCAGRSTVPIKMCHLEESAYSAYVLVPYGSGINYLLSKRVFIKNRQATLKNNFDSLVPSSVVFKKQPWNWKKMYVLLSII